MDIWAGNISITHEFSLEGPSPTLPSTRVDSIGIRLIDPTCDWREISKDATLSLRSFVNSALIPLYARAGPNLEVHTREISSSEWLKRKILENLWPDEESLGRTQSIQCPIGLLVGIGGPARRQASEILIYGVLSTISERLPTPPSSEHDAAAKRELRIYAVPLDSSLITRAQSVPSPPSSPQSGDVQYGQFIPDTRSPSPKRKRVASLFDSVTQHHTNVRSKGDEAVSQLVAHPQSQPSQTLRIKKEEPVLPALGRIAPQHSRSPSLGNLNSRLSESRTEHSRPGSARSRAQSISLKRNASNAFTEPAKTSSPALPSSEGKSDPKDAESAIVENKNLVTKTILTCMRLYGFNRTSVRSSSKAPEADLTGPHEWDSRAPASDGMTLAGANADEEFKSMYHATYRATTFALRKYLREPTSPDGIKTLPPLLEKGKAMSYIDEFLRLFCEEN